MTHSFAWTRWLVASLAIGAPVAGIGTASSVPSSTRHSTPLTWTDLNGRHYGPAGTARYKATVFFFVSTQCPIANLYTPRIIEIARDYAPRGVRCMLVDSNVEDSAAAVRRYASERKFPFPIVKDRGTALADRLAAQTTPEAIIIDRAGKTRYMGRIDDNVDRTKVAHGDVREALDAILSGRPVRTPRTLPFGCAIFRDTPRITAATSPAGSPSVTYAHDVAPILDANCVICHRTGEVAPFALETYPEARIWARSIADYATRRLMPPWKPAAGYGDFFDARYLTTAQIGTISRWADEGAPEGASSAIPPLPKFADPDQWALGKPDMVLAPSRPYHLAAEGRDVYRNFVLPAVFDQDKYVSAIEFRPGNRAVVHHIVTYFDVTGQSAQMDGHGKEPGYTVPGVGIGVEDAIWGEVWVPGSAPRFEPPGVAIVIPAHARIVMQVHYHKDGKPETDLSRMAVYFARGPVRHPIHVVPFGNVFFRLKPGLARQEVESSLVTPIATHLWSIFPHMHMLGRQMRVTATLPDGTVKRLVWIKDWDFNWQATYYYKQPIALPRGTHIVLDAIFDNTEQNPRQPSHPPKLVTFGEQTTDEMCFAFLGMTADGEGPNARPWHVPDPTSRGD